MVNRDQLLKWLEERINRQLEDVSPQTLLIYELRRLADALEDIASTLR